MSLSRIAALLAALLFFALPAGAQIRQPNSSRPSRVWAVRGTLRDFQTSEPMEMVRVSLKKFTGEVFGTNYTHSRGDFEFNGVPNGSYQIVAEAEGYLLLQENIEVLNASREGLTFFLHRTGENIPRATVAGDSVSKHELSMPQKAQEAYRKGTERLYDKSDAKGSIPHFQRAVSIAPDYYEAYFQLGVAHSRLGQAADAESALRKSIALSDDHYAQPDVALAALYINTGRFAEAAELAHRGISLDGAAWQGHYELARALAGLNQWADAEKSAREVRANKPDFAPVYLLLANIYMHEKNAPALIEDLEAYLKIQPNGPDSERARSLLEQVRRATTNAKTPTANPKPQP